MCGIVGLWLENTEADAASALSSAVNILKHRGPDGCGEYRSPDGGPALGHTRLAVIDPSQAGAQPMISDDGQVVLVFNGEIYNYRELRSELRARGADFRGRSDTEVLLRLYLAEGIDLLPRLNGIFAFALYDGRRRELLVARDPLGVKPLYYSELDEGFAFGSEVKALLPVLRAGAHLDLAALHRYLTFLWCPGEGTPFRAVRKLGPGELLRVRDRRIAERCRWCELPQARGASVAIRPSEAVDAVRSALQTAVHRQLVSDAPVGAFLSGGLDSSAVVAFAREEIPDLRCFTIRTVGREPGEVDDLPYARKVASHLGVPLEVVTVDADRMARDIERLVWRLDEPLADPAALNVLYICEVARDEGIKVLLSGAGGDDLFAGYRRHLAARQEWIWSWLPTSILGALRESTRRLDQRSPLGRRLSRLFAGIDKSGDERIVSYFAWTQPANLLPLYTPSMRKEVERVRAEQPMLDFLKGIGSGRGPLERMLALEQRFFLGDHNLVYTDKMSMTAGVEVRVPFLDPDLVELAARLPMSVKRKRIGSGKWVLRRAMKPYLPREIIRRPKTGFGAPLRRWMRHDLRDLMRDLLSAESLQRRNLFNPAAVQKLIEDNDAGRRDAAYTLFSLLCIEIWCRRFVDEDARPRDVSA